MLGIILESTNPYLNLATEDFLLHNRKEDFLVLSVNDPSVIIGKHQVANREVNTRFTDANKIPVIRRISGGGTVYHDRGNLNFAFIRQSEQGKQVDFRLHTQPVIDFLASLGIETVFEGKNDITFKGLKISGNAEHVFRERVLHHGTLLYDASLEHLRKSLKPAGQNYSTRGVESNRTSVTNLKPMLSEIADMSDFVNCMFDYFKKTIPGFLASGLAPEEYTNIIELAESKYKTWDWNFGYGPPYTFTGSFEMAGKTYRCRIEVKDGIIWNCEIEGSNELMAAAKKLIGFRHTHSDILRVFRQENLNATDEDVYSLF